MKLDSSSFVNTSPYRDTRSTRSIHRQEINVRASGCIGSPTQKEDICEIQGQSNVNTLYFDLSYHITKKNAKKMILQNVSYAIQSGQSLAIMGPSGYCPLIRFCILSGSLSIHMSR